MKPVIPAISRSLKVACVSLNLAPCQHRGRLPRREAGGRGARLPTSSRDARLVADAAPVLRAAVRPVGLRGGLLGPRPVRGRGVFDARARGPPVGPVRGVGARRADRLLLVRDQGAVAPQVSETRDASRRAHRDAGAQRVGRAQASRSIVKLDANVHLAPRDRRRDAASRRRDERRMRTTRKRKRRVVDRHRAGRGSLPGERRVSVRGRVRPRVSHRRLATRGLVREGVDALRVRRDEQRKTKRRSEKRD